MLLYCLKCKRKIETKTLKLQRQIKEKYCFHQSVLCAKKHLYVNCNC